MFPEEENKSVVDKYLSDDARPGVMSLISRPSLLFTFLRREYLMYKSRRGRMWVGVDHGSRRCRRSRRLARPSTGQNGVRTSPVSLSPPPNNGWGLITVCGCPGGDG